MKLIKPSFEIMEPASYDLDGMYKHIELCGRTCYKSTDKITPESAKPFVDRMIASKHYAMLEHGTVYLYIHVDFNQHDVLEEIIDKYRDNKYSIVNPLIEEGIQNYGTRRTTRYPEWTYFITTNLRVIVENGWFEDLQYICAPTKYHIKRHTVKFICNRQVSHEFVRHRVFSFAQESTRYCNYTKDKFGNELTFIWPLWLGDTTPDELDALRNSGIMVDYQLTPGETDLLQGLSNIEKTYFTLIESGWKPQEAATILPNALKTELIMTGFTDDWEHFFDLRALGTTGAPHPQAMELAKPLLKEFINRKYLKGYQQ